MTQPGRASIEIVGDVSKLGRQLQRDTQRAVDNLDIDTTELSNEIGEGFQKGAAEGVEAFEDAERHIQELFDAIQSGASDAAENVALHFEEGGVRIVRTLRETREESRRTFRGMSDDADGAGDAIGGLARFASRSFSRLGDVLSTVGSKITDSLGSLIDPSSLITIGLQTVAYAALSTVIIGLAAALADLAGFVTILPGAIGVLTSSLIVGIVAFQGFGDALSAVVEGDPEKIAEAMERLAPAARKVVKEFQELLPLFRRVGDSIQQEFFEPLVGVVERFGEDVLPRLRNELDVLAQSMGRALGNLGDLVTDAGNVGILERVLASTARITDELGAAVADLGQAFLNALDASLPGLEELSGRLADAITNLAAFINTSIENGSFQEFLDDAIATLDELLALGGALGELLGVVFGATDDAGRGFIGTLTDLTQRMTEFFKSAEGQRVLERVGDTLELIGQIAGFVVNAFVFLGEAGNDLVDAFNAVVDFFDRAGDGIGRFWDGLVDTVSGAVESVVEFFTALPGRVAAFLSALPGQIAAFFQAAIDRALSVLAFGIAAVIVFFTDLPGQLVGAFNALTTFISEQFDAIRDRAAEIVSNVVTFFQELPGKIGAFLASLPGTISTFFGQARDAAVSRLTSLVEFVKGLPGKILSALGNVGTMLLDSGKKIVQGLIDGISSKIGALREKIVSAVQTIRDHLPFSPAKVGPLSGAGSPDIAGATIARMIAEGLESGLPLITGAASRSAGAVADAGVAPLVGATAGGAPPVLPPTSVSVEQQPVFIVQIGNEEIEAFIDRRVDQRVDVEVRRLMAGSRGI